MITPKTMAKISRCLYLRRYITWIGFYIVHDAWLHSLGIDVRGGVGTPLYRLLDSNAGWYKWLCWLVLTRHKQRPATHRYHSVYICMSTPAVTF